MTLASARDMKRNSLDFLLAAIGGLTVTYALGMSIASSKLATVFTLLFAASTSIGYLLSLKYPSTKAHTISAWLYVFVSLASPLFARGLNGFLPDGGFPRELIFSAGPLIWMLILGGLFAWTDGALSFQSVPVIALFGLVGAFNTFQPAVFLFFVFLVCAASLYARCHQRHMLERAERSGYRHLSTLRQGPWRWMAGPEWALASAAAIIILSLIGAPVLQQSVRNVAGVVRIAAPKVQPPAPVANLINSFSNTSTRVGTGPRGEISEEEVFRFKAAEPRYLRMQVFVDYQNGRWDRYVPVPGTELRNRQSTFPFPTAEQLEQNFNTQSFEMKVHDWFSDKLPVPSPCLSITPGYMLSPEMDGTIRITSTALRGERVRGEYASRKRDREPKSVTQESTPLIERLRDKQSIPSKIRELANEVIDPKLSDYENAFRLKAEIEKRSKYNLRAEAAPEGNDPAEYFLFGEKREGYCDLFATAMVLMARSANIPARYIAGYYPIKMERDEEGFYILRKADYHAWAELHFEGYGWIPFDATEGAQAVPGGERGTTRDQLPWHKQAWVKPAQNILFGLVGLSAFFVMLRGIQRLRPSVEPVQRIAQGAFDAFVLAIEAATGESRHPSDGPREYFTRTRSALPTELVESGEALLESFIAVMYGGTRMDQDQANQLQRQVDAWSRDLKAARKRAATS